MYRVKRNQLRLSPKRISSVPALELTHAKI